MLQWTAAGNVARISGGWTSATATAPSSSVNEQIGFKLRLPPPSWNALSLLQETSKASKPKKEAKAPKAPKEEKGKKKKKKDKDAPKSALSAYMFFMNRNREKIKEANPEASFGDLGRLAGAQWKEMDAEGKSEYEQAAREDKERYKREMDAYKAKLRAAVEDDGDDDDDAPAAGSDDDADE